MSHKLSRFKSINPENTLRQVEETVMEEKIPLFTGSETGFVVAIAAVLSSGYMGLATALSVIYGGIPIIEVLAWDAGILSVGMPLAIQLAQKMNYSVLSSCFSFDKGTVKARFLFPGQTHIEKAANFRINEEFGIKSSGLYSLASHIDNSSRATHEVETSIIQKWNGSSIVQTVTPMADYVWDGMLESITGTHVTTDSHELELNAGNLSIESMGHEALSMADRIADIEKITEKAMV